MIYSDIVNKTGLLQEIEFWTLLGDGGVSGSPTLINTFRNRLNRAYDKVMPLVLSGDDIMRWDDTNHTTHPIGSTSINATQGDYSFIADSTGNSVLNISKILIKTDTTTTFFTELRKAEPESREYTRALSPQTTDVGIPTHYVERGNSFFLFPVPNYTVANTGIKIFYERSPSYFIAGGADTITPGIPETFHPLLVLIAVLDWLIVVKPDNTMLITRVEAEIALQKKDLSAMIDKRNVRRTVMKARYNNSE